MRPDGPRAPDARRTADQPRTPDRPGTPDRGRQLATRAHRSIAEAQRERDAGDLRAAIEHAAGAYVLLAKACLDRDGVRSTRPREVTHEYLVRFGRGGRLYAAYYRWMLDAADLARACALELPGAADPVAVSTAIERAETFSDSVARFLEKEPPKTAEV